MRITPLVMGSVFIFVLIVVITVGSFNQAEGNKLYEDQVYKQLLSIAQSKAERVEVFLDNRKADAVFLAGSEDVKNIFDEKLSRDIILITGRIKRIAEDTTRDAGDYIREHPNMSLEDLQGSEEFEDIVLRLVDKTGYTFAYDYDSMINSFHVKDKFLGINYSSLKNLPSRESWWKLTGPTQYGESELGGFYLWKEPDGSFREKYKYTSIVSARTADGIGLAIGASGYLDEYGETMYLAADLDREMREFQKYKEYSNMIFINLDGDVIWTAEENDELGTNLIMGIYNDSLLANIFNKAKKSLEVEVSDSKEYGTSGRLKIFITAPVMKVSNLNGEGELLGFVALELDNEKISELIVTDVGLGDAGEVYIINKERHHITPLKFDNHTSSQSEDIRGEHEEIVVSEGVKNCFRDYDNYYASLRGEEIKEVDKIGRYLDYAEDPNMVLGAHQYILESGWCVIAEMDEEYFLEVIPYTNRDMMINLFVDLILLLVVCLVLDSFFRIRGKGVK